MRLIIWCIICMPLIQRILVWWCLSDSIRQLSDTMQYYSTLVIIVHTPVYLQLNIRCQHIYRRHWRRCMHVKREIVTVMLMIAGPLLHLENHHCFSFDTAAQLVSSKCDRWSFQKQLQSRLQKWLQLVKHVENCIHKGCSVLCLTCWSDPFEGFACHCTMAMSASSIATQCSYTQLPYVALGQRWWQKQELSLVHTCHPLYPTQSYEYYISEQLTHQTVNMHGSYQHHKFKNRHHWLLRLHVPTEISNLNITNGC